MKNHVPHIKTCRKLRDAGFPQEDSPFFYYRTDQNKWKLAAAGMNLTDEASQSTSGDYAAAPLLTELLEKLPLKAGVEVVDGTPGQHEYFVSESISEDGSQLGTLDRNAVEAAARLWLSLNTE